MTRSSAGSEPVKGPAESPILHVVLVEPEIHTNTGNIGRLCVAAGAALHLVEPLGFEITDARLKRAGLDYWKTLEWHRYSSFSDCERRLAKPDRGMWYATGRGRRVYTEVPYRPGDALVFGKESAGLPSELIETHRESTIRIPIRPIARSLNVAHAVGIVVFEALRQFEAAGLPSADTA